MVNLFAYSSKEFDLKDFAILFLNNIGIFLIKNALVQIT